MEARTHIPLFRLICLATISLSLVAVAVHYSRRPKSAIVAASPTPKTKQDFLTLVTNTVPFTWKDLDSPDYVQYIANLRKVGCTRETLIDIIVSEVNRLYTKRALELLSQSKEDLKFVYWRVGTNAYKPYQTRRLLKERLTVLDDERRKLLSQLLPELKREEMLDPFFDLLPLFSALHLMFLSEEKRRAVEQLQREGRLEIAKRIKPMVSLTKEDQQFLAESNKALDARLQSILTPEELFQYHLSSSATSGRLSQQLTGMEPTEQEYVGIFKLRYEFDRKWDSENLPDSPTDLVAYYREQRALKAQLQEVLGEARYADYQRSIDPLYGTVRRFVDNQGLPPEQAAALYDFRKEINQSVERIRTTTLAEDVSDRPEIIALKQEAMQKLVNKIGQAAAEQYVKSPEFGWLNRLGIPPNPDEGKETRSVFLGNIPE